MKLEAKEIGLFFYGIILSTVISIIAFIFLRIEGIGSELLWKVLESTRPVRFIYIAGITLVGGCLLGICRKHWGNLPLTAHDSMAELKATKTIDYRSVFKSLLVALIVLVFGAGVGPEAGLLSAVIACSVWQADKLRYYYFNYPTLRQLSVKQRVGRLMNPVAYLLTYDEERAEKAGKQRKKKHFYGVFIVNGLVSFILLMKLTGQPSFISKMGDSHWQWTELWLILPLIIFGVLYGKAYHVLQRVAGKVFDFWQDAPIRKALVGSLAIFLIASFVPKLLFSGQLSLSLVPFIGTQASFLFLTLMALIKLVFLQICLNTGWVGGDIFPIVFSAIIQGFAMAQLFPEWDRLLIVSVVSASISMTIIDSPLVVGVFVMLFFPLTISPVILLTVLLIVGGKKGLTKMISRKIEH